jgi:hypothetical protein
MAFTGFGDIRGFITGGALRRSDEGLLWDFYDQAGVVLTSIPYDEFAKVYAPVPSIDWAKTFGSVNGVAFYDFFAPPAVEPEPEPVPEPAPAPVKDARDQDYWDRFVERLFGIFR